MGAKGLLVANRGEVALRILRAAGELGVRAVAVFSEDDADSPHAQRAEATHPLPGTGPSAYLDAAQILAAAAATGCDAIHPGYGFLSESATFAARCAEEGVRFVGPRPETLQIFGDKARARALAARCGVPIPRGTERATTLDEARAFLDSLGAGGSLMVKAVAGGGGRGMRAARTPDELARAFERCVSEARASFGSGDVYVEERLLRARHIEVQIAGDGSEVVHLFERECSLQRRFQKLVEIAPCPSLSEALRAKLTEAALRLAREVRYEGLGTFEFLVDASEAAPGAGVARLPDDTSFVFIEANPRLQVEHTVTEEVLGIDLVRAQLELAFGRSLGELGLGADEIPKPRGFALQARVNLERMDADGSVRPSGGTLTAFEPPGGPGLRTDACATAGYTTNPRFDSLLAKVVAHVPTADFGAVVTRAGRALGELRVEGVATNLLFLRALLARPEVRENRVHTGFVEENAAALAEAADGLDAGQGVAPRADERADAAALAGARIDTSDPLAVLDHGKSGATAPDVPVAAPNAEPTSPAPHAAPHGTRSVTAPIQGTLVSVLVREGDLVHEGRTLFVMEAMKMEHEVAAQFGGRVVGVAVAPGDTVFEGHALAFLAEEDVPEVADGGAETIDLDRVRPDLAEVHERHRLGEDEARPEAVARRRKTRQRTARENVRHLCDPGSFTEYGPLVIAAQRRRRSVEDLVRNTPADGMLAGVGTINEGLFPGADARCVVMSYDYTVLAGTQGLQNHRKKDRMFELAESWRLPVVFFTEGGGGRPGDTDGSGVAGLDCMAFHYFGRLSGLVPLVGINSGRCFAGNAALLGCCDVVIATEGSNIGMGGPAMIEGGGLGIFRPEEVGPLEVQVANGVVDIAVEDEDEAVRVAQQYLAYFQGTLEGWACVDQRALRAAIPENRLRIYDVRRVIEGLADTGSVLELRRGFGAGMLTALARIEGRPLGIVANNPTHLAGAIDSDGADKAARFLQLCDAFDIPVLFLCDTPGIMVGPEVERTALVRHASRLFVTGASLSVPFFTIVLRKGYGLGAQAMAGGSFRAPFFTVAWPTGEFGGMGLEGAVKLGYRKELAAVEDPEKRRALFDEMVERMYAHGKAVNMASHFEIDEVIDPADSRRWILTALRSAPPPAARTQKKRPCIDTW